jgi:serine/threonine protein kinase
MATDRFSEKKEIGKGGFGVVYSGSLKKKDVAVKKILKDSRGEFKDFLAELGSIDGTGHVNLVRLEGWCCSINNYMFWCLGRQHVELFLVYELVPNGTLHQHLYEKSEVLSWEMRYNFDTFSLFSCIALCPIYVKYIFIHKTEETSLMYM